MVLALIVAVLNAYICQKCITLKSEAKGKAISAEFFRFSAAYAVTICLNLVLLPALVEIGHITPKIEALQRLLFLALDKVRSSGEFTESVILAMIDAIMGAAVEFIKRSRRIPLNTSVYAAI